MYRAAAVAVVGRVHHELIIGTDGDVVFRQGKIVEHLGDAFETVVELTVSDNKASPAGGGQIGPVFRKDAIDNHGRTEAVVEAVSARTCASGLKKMLSPRQSRPIKRVVVKESLAFSRDSRLSRLSA